MKTWQNWTNLPIQTNDGISLPDEITTLLPKSEQYQDHIEFLKSVRSHSPYLSSLMDRSDMLQEIFAKPPIESINSILESLELGLNEPQDNQQFQSISLDNLMKLLRKAKQKIALILALGDLSKSLTLYEVTSSLSKFAAIALDYALIFSLKNSIRLKDSKEPWPNHDKPLSQQLRNSGITILAMGKLGAYELNYSSDIDLIILYEPKRLSFCNQERLLQDFIRTAHMLTKIMEAKTGDGYVFRTDLRLRPDPSITPPAITIEAAEIYYETIGLDWERAAMIKARPIAGNIDLGNQFLNHIRPFIWRKHLDFNALENIRSIKKQIEVHRSGTEINFGGHNIKLGHGGIREIEFYAQTEQLIWGGRRPNIRVKDTTTALNLLNDEKIITNNICQDLKESYVYLRNLEHRIQMIDDQQTQTLPETDDKLLAIGYLMGFSTLKEFETETRFHLNRVGNHFDQKFKQDTITTSNKSKLNLLSIDDDQATLAMIESMGFSQASMIIGQMKLWAQGRYRATRTERAREILSNIAYDLLLALAKTVDPNQAFLSFDRFLEKLPSGVQLFSLFQANPPLMRDIAEIMGNAPRLADLLSNRAHLLETFLDPAQRLEFESSEGLRQSLLNMLKGAIHDDYEQNLVTIRNFAAERQFQIGVQYLNNNANIIETGKHLSDIATCVIETLTPIVIEEFAKQHGLIEGANYALVAFGKLGSRELLPASDIDLVFIYDLPQSNDQPSDKASDLLIQSSGEKPLYPQVYFQRLVQRLVSALEREMQGGKLFEIDLRLRPGGNGALATQYEGFESYYRLEEGVPAPDTAWSWEYLALTRARVIYSNNPSIKDKLEQLRLKAIRQPRNNDKFLQDVFEMRQRIANERDGQLFWDVKNRRGGVLDIEFIVQSLIVSQAHLHPTIMSAGGDTILGFIENLQNAKVITQDEAIALSEAAIFWRSLQAMFRLTVSSKDFDESNVPLGLKQSLSKICALKDIQAIRERADKISQAIQIIFDNHIKNTPSPS